MTPTPKFTAQYPTFTLADFLRNGWTEAQLINYGFAQPAPWAPVLATPPAGVKAGSCRAAEPNMFGIEDLNTVAELWREIAANRKRAWPNGWTLEQHQLLVAEELVRRYL